MFRKKELKIHLKFSFFFEFCFLNVFFSFFKILIQVKGEPHPFAPFFLFVIVGQKKGRTEEKVFFIFVLCFSFFFLVVEQKACRSSCGDRLERTDYYWRTWRNIANVVAAGCAKVRFSFYFFLVVVVIVAVSCELRVFVSFRCLPAFITSFFLMCFFFVICGVFVSFGGRGSYVNNVLNCGPTTYLRRQNTTNYSINCSQQ